MKKLFILFISIVMVVSCNDDFLNTENKNTLDSGSFLKTESELQIAINAAYTPLAYEGMFGLIYFKVFNALDPNIWFEGMSGFDIFNFNPSIYEIKTMYEDLYFGLFRTSDILAKMPTLKDKITPENYTQYEGQLKALRGMYYFYLVTLWDKPVYYDETNVPVDPVKSYTNGTQEEFWTKLEQDLDFASANLPEKWASEETGRITKAGAQAQLGKVLLYKHYHYYLRFGKENTPEATANILKAKNALKDAMNSSSHHLIMPALKTKAHYQAALLSNFSFIDIPVDAITYKGENNNESLWEIQYNDNPGTNVYLPAYLMGGNMLAIYFSANLNGYRNMVVDPALWKEFESTTGHPAGYTKDPRAYATCYMDGDLMDWRPESGYNVAFKGDVNAKSGLFGDVYAGFTESKGIGLKKYYYPTFTTGSAPAAAPINVRVIRLSDVMLMYAEACYQSNTDINLGLKALNDVRARVDMPAISELTPSTIHHERKVELATEGLYYNDLIRWSFDARFEINFVTLYNGKFNVKKNLYFPIPQYEIDANKGALKQNPGW